MRWRRMLWLPLGFTALIASGCFGPHRSWGGHRGGGEESRFAHGCDRWSEGDRLDRALRRAEGHLDITEAQRPAWDKLAGEVRGAIGDVCAAAGPESAGESAGDAASALRRFERVAEVSRDALGRIRPAFDALYAELDPRQRRHVDSFFAQRRFV